MVTISLVKFILLIYLAFYSEVGLTEDYVGCLFSRTVCENHEICYNDDAFGKCVSQHSSDQTTLYKYSLTPSTLLILQRAMERLYSENHKWNHKYTQCIVQTILEAHRFKADYDPKMCNEQLIKVVENESDTELTPKQIQEILSAKEMAEEVSPYDVAYIRFKPSIREDLKNFADEIFAPLPPNEVLLDEDIQLHPSKKLDPDYKDAPDFEKLLALQYLREISKNPAILDTEDKQNDVYQEKAVDSQSLPGFSEGTKPNAPLHIFRANKGKFRDFAEVKKSDNKQNSSDQGDQDLEQEFLGDFYNLWQQNEPLPYELGDDLITNGNIAVRRDDPNMLSTFQRWDRLDTKKPGPEFPQHGQPREEDLLVKENMKLQKNKNSPDESKLLNELIHEVHQDSPVAGNPKPHETVKIESTTNSIPYIPVVIPVAKKQQHSARNELKDYVISEVTKNSSAGKDVYDAVDSSYTYLRLNQKLKNENDAIHIVRILENKLELPLNTFSDIKADGNQITFRVNKNPRFLNASQVANEAESYSPEIEKRAGFAVESSGIGDEVKLEVARKNQGQFAFILAFVLVGTAFGILVAAVVVYVVRRHARTKAKLRDISNQDTEASLDYQDLCRQRMASKTNEKPEPIHIAQAQRISSLSQSEGSAASPTSRSSTSSWSEEPVTSNMDISTGHVILSYMEDHLKNKDRLDREWEALCAYEAEPCCTDCATAPNNIKKNRFPNVIPYEHSRVILNETTNINGSNYINASSITDHDPRTPAYIATQGPLPHTAADFWQMVWEQGSVVIVMLTRLMENGVALCHRYWPEEGSELYHIYEVHLVSEHIWCDDYLIRSFYLKNLKTSETRTVTQFHFLSWPENGVPPSIKAMLEFRRKVNKSFRGRSCPIITHCSDGSGRTGTYCLIDMVLNRMDKGAKEIDIAATLEHIRDQRVAMVKTKAQFEFVLMSIAEEVHAILKAMPQ